MANLIYNKAKVNFANGTIDWDTTVIKVALVDSSSTYTPDPDHTSLGTDVFATSTWEADGTGHTRGFGGTGRKQIATPVVNQDDANDRAELDCDDVLWSALSAGTIKALVVYVHDTNDPTSYPILWIDQPSGAGGFSFVSNGGDFTFAPNVEGLIQLT